MPPNVATMLAAAAAALTVRFVVLRGRGNPHSASNGDHEIEDPEAIARTGLVPVSVAWDNIHCVVRDKAGNVVRCCTSTLENYHFFVAQNSGLSAALSCNSFESKDCVDCIANVPVVNLDQRTLHLRKKGMVVYFVSETF